MGKRTVIEGARADDFIRRYQAGQSLKDIAKAAGAKATTIRNFLVASGIEVRPYVKPLPIHELARRYLAGESEMVLAKAFGVSRGIIRPRLIAAGITPRGRSDGMYVRMSRTNADERRRLASAANVSWRGIVRPTLELIERAAFRERYPGILAGSYEQSFVDWLGNRGVLPIPQKAVERYNLDVGIEPVAVELWNSAGQPLRVQRNRAKTEYLVNAGWSVLWIWSCGRWPLGERAADDAVAFYHLCKADPSALGQYRVVRGTGEFVSQGRL